jgi:hypothetical protein
LGGAACAPCRKSSNFKKEIALLSEMNEHSYFFTFNQEERRWYVLTPNFGHMQSVRVINDDDAAVTVDVTMDGEGPTIIN